MSPPPASQYEDKYKDYLPKAAGGDKNATSGIRVSTEALKVFSQNLRLLITPLRDVQSKIGAVQLAPGAFFDAHELVIKVTGGSGGKGTAVQPATLDFIVKAIQAITVTADELDKLAAAYKSAEELNKATGRDLGDHIQSAKDYIARATGVAAPAAVPGVVASPGTAPPPVAAPAPATSA
ncbi:hypothetical protein [Lentzea sp. NPDC004782]|uniref:hypothetical protein n=1 Tax=Lentzea sp. NPDC004782 TaxID=3154458 RepID=UPI0033B99C4B